MKYLKTKTLILVFLTVLICMPQVYANILLRVLVINPSKSQAQKVPVKVYLPKEVKPEHVVDREDLEIAYDDKEGAYYLQGEYALKPGEALEKEVELKDVWQISSEELQSLKTEADKLKNLLANTEFSDRVEFLYQGISQKINEIADRQSVKVVNPQEHISSYRNNLVLLDSINSDLNAARSMLSRAKSFPSTLIWRLVIFILGFLGVLGFGFYLVWQKQAKISAEQRLYEGTDQVEEEFSGKEHQETQQSDQGEDIEKILRGE